MYLCVFLYTEMFPSFLQPGIEREFKALQSWTFDCCVQQPFWDKLIMTVTKDWTGIWLVCKNKKSLDCHNSS